MSPEDYAELMEEPPGGHNHGFRRTEEQVYVVELKHWSRVWIPLGDEARQPKPLLEPAEHGTITGYFTRGCRCEECRQTARDWKRRQRAKNV